MEELTKDNNVFQKLYVTKQEALDLFSNNPFKVYLINKKIGELSMTTVYRCGDFVDLCTGPHIKSTNMVKAIKILKNSSSYWLGKSSNDVL